MKRLLLIGNFGLLNNKLDGQTIKTRNIKTLLENNYCGILYYFDTSYLHKKPLLIFKMLYLVIKCNTSIVVPASGFLAKLFPLIYYVSKVFRRNLIHIGVGGWQMEFFSGKGGKYSEHINIMRICKNIKAFFVEIDNVRKDLIKSYGFSNIEVFPNFRFSDFVPKNCLQDGCLRLVYMGRIMKPKGYETLIEVIASLRNNNRVSNITLDLYGQIEKDDYSSFLKAIEVFPEISYKGVLNPNEIYKTLNEYDVLVFPTRYYTEGFPGTILDAYMSGIPVIVTNWKHASEFVKDGVTGYIVNFENPTNEIIEKILNLYDNKELLMTMKDNSYNMSREFSADVAWNRLNKYLC